MQHKWHKEIKAWADGAEIEFNLGNAWNKWIYIFEPLWDMDDYKFRIKPQPKEPQYLYVFDCETCGIVIRDKPIGDSDELYIGKIKLEVDDV